MNRTTVVILAGALLVVVLLCAALLAGIIVTQDNAHMMGWEQRWERDRGQWGFPMAERPAIGRVGLLLVGLLGLVSCLVLAGGLVLGGVWLAGSSRRSSEPRGLVAPAPGLEAGPPAEERQEAEPER
jgi:hypothetical protein